MIVGRKEEQYELRRAYESEYSEFVAVTGRRRVGKTYLVREVFSGKIAFQHSGLANQKTRMQLSEFRQSLLVSGMKKCRVPSDWFDAFHLLSDYLSSLPEGKKVVFIDELPWMDAPRSNFVSALEHFWNGYASARKDILLIICGSATSWIINNVFRNHGGLHNRVTYRINLQPFTLKECEEYARFLHLSMNRYELLETYMVMGGIPFYWSLLDRRYSAAQNIDQLFFNHNGKLRYEFNDLYDSLFKNPAGYIRIVSALGQIRKGMTREELSRKASLDNNGGLTRMLDDLEACGFIRRYKQYGVKRNNAIFQLTDNYTLFYYLFIRKNDRDDEHFWTLNLNKPLFNAWSGLAFERICFQHTQQIKQALGISGVSTVIYPWSTKGDAEHEGAQIDLVIDRADQVTDLLEMKFSTDKYDITKDDDKSFRHKIAAFQRESGTTKTIHTILVTNQGVKEGMYRFSVQNVITADDLFG